jgi:predicted ATPase
MMLGLVGAHRTGKTTLARRFAEVSGYKSVETNVSDVFRDYGLDPREHYPLEKRLWIQLRILERLEATYAANKNYSVFDRTPIDLAAYMLADVSRQAISPYTDREIASYVEACLLVTNRYFSGVVVVQPGIPVVEDINKAPASASYMEHINALCLGLMSNPSLKRTQAFSLSRYCTDLDERCECLINIVSQIPEPAHVIQFEQKFPM